MSPSPPKPPPAIRGAPPGAAYGLCAFLGAFLLFQVQPLLGKTLLPWFGGAAAVWTTCLVFFQGMLLLGYLLVDAAGRAARRLQARPGAAERGLSVLLLAASLACLPLGPSPALRPGGAVEPIGGILWVLLRTVGLPYLFLATTSPGVQLEYLRRFPGRSPYRLYAASNLGSMLALLGQPFLLDPLLGRAAQGQLWTGLFLAFAGLRAWLLRHAPAAAEPGMAPAPTPTAARGGGPGPEEPDDPFAVPIPRAPLLTPGLTWTLLALCPALLLSAITAQLTENVAPVPLLWVLPLALYLLTLVLCFEHPRAYRRGVLLGGLPLSIGVLAVLPTIPPGDLGVAAPLGLTLLCFTHICLVCHGELARLRPEASEALSRFYVAMALGGVLGGLFVAVLAPLTFDGPYELSVGLVLTGAVVAAVAIRGHRFRHRELRRRAVGFSLICLLLVAGISGLHQLRRRWEALFSERNFYGTVRVFEYGEGPTAHRTLMHSGIIHGLQFTAPGHELDPIAYYAEEAGSARTLRALSRRGPLHVGVVGLGAGTLAAFGRAGDRFRLYELDPLVARVAWERFDFLRRTPAATTIVLGDGRLSLEREPDQGFDALFLDAFSGDAVPMHLLTEEALDIYLRHLKPDGALLFDVTNRYLRLAPVIAAAAEPRGLVARLVAVDWDADRQVLPSTWLVMTRTPALFDAPELRDAAVPVERPPGVEAWRDDHGSLLQALR